MRYAVTTEWRRQRKVGGATRQELLSKESEEFEWPDSVAGAIASFLEEHRRAWFSGMEDFGQGGCLMYPVSLRCRAYGDCRYHHIESVREWTESRVDELGTGESTDFVVSGMKWAAITVEALPDPEPDIEDDEEEPEEEPADEGPAAQLLRRLLGS